MKKKSAAGAEKGFRGSYTVEAAGVMAIIMFTMMILLNTAFHVRAETVGVFDLHMLVERERHETDNIGEHEITKCGSGQRWSIEVTAPVFRPENSLRLWGVTEKILKQAEEGK